MPKKKSKQGVAACLVHFFLTKVGKGGRCASKLGTTQGVAACQLFLRQGGVGTDKWY